MANIGSIVRKNLRDLSNSMEMRELNRQLDWMWKKILGGLTSKDFSDSGMRSVVEVVEKTIASEIAADEVTTNILKTALAEMMVAKIGVAKIDYAQIVDMFSERIFTDEGLAGEFRMDKLKVYQAQIVDLIVNSFRLVSDDGKVYKITVDKDGNLATEYMEDQDTWLNNGELPDGYSAVASDLTIGEVSAGKLYVAGAADIMKLTAKTLIADTAWISELTATTAFIDSITTNKIFGGKSLEVILNDLNEAARIFRQEEAPSGDDGARVNDIWIIPTSGESYQAAAAQEEIPRFGLEDDGVTLGVYLDEGSDLEFKFQEGALWGLDFAFRIEDDGYDAPYYWALVRDAHLNAGMIEAQVTADAAGNAASDALDIANAAVTKLDFERIVRFDSDGLHVGDNQTNCEVLVDSASVNVVVGGARVSTYSDKFIRLDNMQIRKVKGGMAISVYRR